MKDLSRFLKNNAFYYITNRDQLGFMIDTGTSSTTLPRGHILLSHLRVQGNFYIYFKVLFGI